MGRVACPGAGAVTMLVISGSGVVCELPTQSQRRALQLKVCAYSMIFPSSGTMIMRRRFDIRDNGRNRPTELRPLVLACKGPRCRWPYDPGGFDPRARDACLSGTTCIAVDLLETDPCGTLRKTLQTASEGRLLEILTYLEKRGISASIP
jgi:hypothetical protein